MISTNVILPLDMFVSELPVARCQLVAICRALVQDVRLIAMDEPTALLTRQEVRELLQVAYQLRGHGIYAAFVSHRLEEVMEVSDHTSTLKDGGLVGTFSAAEMTTKQLGFLITGQEFEYQVRELWQGKSDTPALEVRNLGRHGEYLDINLWVEAGEMVSVVGLLDTGHTELRLSLLGMTRLDAGEILIDGQLVTLYNNQDAIRHGTGHVLGDRMSHGLVMAQSIEDNIISTVFRKVKDRSGFLSEAKVCDLMDGLIKASTIKVSDPHPPVNTLSGGNAQRVSTVK